MEDGLKILVGGTGGVVPSTMTTKSSHASSPSACRAPYSSSLSALSVRGHLLFFLWEVSHKTLYTNEGFITLLGSGTISDGKAPTRLPLLKSGSSSSKPSSRVSSSTFPNIFALVSLATHSLFYLWSSTVRTTLN